MVDDDPTPRASLNQLMVPDGAATTQPGTQVNAGPDAETMVPSGATAAAMVQLPPPGYQIGDPIGRGGMGEVLTAQDLRIGREVAVKRMTAVRPNVEQVSRFLREARIQARLEHPTIVPVHELGVDENGRLFFTMKRLVGRTLGHRLTDGLSLNAALRAFVDVCLAIDFSHAKGVIHRDLKPSNIMLGEYGEVYLIDWGIARVPNEDSDDEIGQPDIVTLDEGTKSGALLGTPGYMSPEVLRGQRATPASDVYGLGAILFEILAGEPLHKRGEAGIASTLRDPQVSPAERKPERAIAPELDAVCFAALHEAGDKRPTARDVANKVQEFLDGDRDLERRRELAQEQLAAARAVLASNAPDARAAGMRRAGRALALDPQSEEAAELVSGLLLSPPPVLPPDLARGLEDHELQISKDRSRRVMYTYLSLFTLLPFATMMDVKNWGMVFGFYATVLVATLGTFRWTQTGRPSVPVVLVVNMMLVLLFSRIASPFILTPLLIGGMLAALTAIPGINRHRWLVVGWTVATVMLPIGFEWLDVLPDTWYFGDGMLMIVSNIVRSAGLTTEVALVIGNLLLTLVFGLFVLSVARQRQHAQQQLYVQAWHLRQLLPSAKQPWVTR